MNVYGEDLYTQSQMEIRPSSMARVQVRAGTRAWAMVKARARVQDWDQGLDYG